MARFYKTCAVRFTTKYVVLKMQKKYMYELVHLVKVCFTEEVQGNMFLSLLEPACKRSIRLPGKGVLVEIDLGVLL